MPLENENKVVNDIRDEPVNEIVAEPIEEIVGQKSIDQDVLKKGKKELNDGEDRVDIFWLWSSSWLPSLFWFALGSGFSSTGATPTKVVIMISNWEHWKLNTPQRTPTWRYLNPASPNSAAFRFRKICYIYLSLQEWIPSDSGFNNKCSYACQSSILPSTPPMSFVD